MLAKKILVIETQVPMRRNIALLQKLESFAVGIAKHSTRGMETRRCERPAPLVCDVRMPELHSSDVVQAPRIGGAAAARVGADALRGKQPDKQSSMEIGPLAAAPADATLCRSARETADAFELHDDAQ